MKRCRRCGRNYTDISLNFCLEDGELLMQESASNEPDTLFHKEPPTRFADESPTVMMNQARVTNETRWPEHAGNSDRQSQPAAWQPSQQQMFAPLAQHARPDQTLAIVSLCLGAAAMTVGWCCSAGLLLSPASIVTGIIALTLNKKDPQRYSGRGLAIGGIVAGGLYIVLYIALMLVYGAALLLGPALGG